MHVSQENKFWFFFPSLMIDRNSFSICILYLQGLMDIDKKYTHQVHLKYKSLSLNTLVRRKKKKFQIFLVSESVSFPEKKQLTTKDNAFLTKKMLSVLLSMCKKCHWKLRVQRPPKVLEIHLVCFLVCVTIPCRLSYAQLLWSFLIFKGALWLLFLWNENSQMKLSSLLRC